MDLYFDRYYKKSMFKDLSSTKSIKNKVTEEFAEVLRLLDWKNKGHDIFKRWYIDGRVYYHKMVDEDKALSEIFRVLKKGGRVFVTDSAMMLLWSKHDVAAHAGKRFDKVTLWGPMEDAGFKIEKMSYFNTLLFIPVFLARKLGNQPGEVSTDITELPTILNEFLYYLYITELWFLKWISYPFGVSIFAVGRK